VKAIRNLAGLAPGRAPDLVAGVVELGEDRAGLDEEEAPRLGEPKDRRCGLVYLCPELASRFRRALRPLDRAGMDSVLLQRTAELHVESRSTAALA